MLIIGIVLGLVVLMLIVLVIARVYIVRKRQSQSFGSRDKYEMNAMSQLGKMARTFSMHMARLNGEFYRTT